MNMITIMVLAMGVIISLALSLYVREHNSQIWIGGIILTLLVVFLFLLLGDASNWYQTEMDIFTDRYEWCIEQRNDHDICLAFAGSD